VKYPLSLRNIADLVAERGVDIGHETVRSRWNRFGPMLTGEIRKMQMARMRGYPQWRWHLDEAVAKINADSAIAGGLSIAKARYSNL